MGMFKQYAEQLVAEGKAYYCFCTEERLEALHAAQRAAGEMTHYDGCCREQMCIRDRGHRAHHHGLPCHPAWGRGGH